MQTERPLNHRPEGVVSRAATLFRTFSSVEKFAVTMVALCLLIQLYLQFVQKINWDEFYFLSMVHDYQRGELAVALQSFHVHFFGWITHLGWNEVQQIVAARIVMWACQVVTVVLIVGTLQAFISRTGALFAALAWLCAGAVLVHGASFRADPLAACLIMVSIYILARCELSGRALVISIVAAGVAAMVTLKVALYAPVFIGLVVWRVSVCDNRSVLIRRFSLCAPVLLLVFSGLYLVHHALLQVADPEQSRQLVSRAVGTGFLTAGLFPRSELLAPAIFSAGLQTLLLIAGAGVAVYTIVLETGSKRTPSLMLMVLAMPLISFMFYRNAFPYFFPFIFLTATGLIGLLIDRLREREVLQIGLALILFSGMAAQFSERISEDLKTQRETIDIVHKIFPEPVHYIDRCSMISGFPKRGFFMSGWGIRNYQNTGEPIFEQILSEQVVPLLILNSQHLQNAVDRRAGNVPETALMAEDITALRQNYIAHWGHIWVAGKTMTLAPGTTSFRIEIPGLYTVEAVASVEIDGTEFASGAAVQLVRGDHTVKSTQQMELTLRWGDHLLRPETPAPEGPLFSGF